MAQIVGRPHAQITHVKRPDTQTDQLSTFSLERDSSPGSSLESQMNPWMCFCLGCLKFPGAGLSPCTEHVLREIESEREPDCFPHAHALHSCPTFSEMLTRGGGISLSLPRSFKGISEGQTTWDKRSQIRSFVQIVADFCSFSLLLGITASQRRRF